MAISVPKLKTGNLCVLSEFSELFQAQSLTKIDSCVTG